MSLQDLLNSKGVLASNETLRTVEGLLRRTKFSLLRTGTCTFRGRIKGIGKLGDALHEKTGDFQTPQGLLEALELFREHTEGRYPTAAVEIEIGDRSIEGIVDLNNPELPLTPQDRASCAGLDLALDSLRLDFFGRMLQAANDKLSKMSDDILDTVYQKGKVLFRDDGIPLRRIEVLAGETSHPSEHEIDFPLRLRSTKDLAEYLTWKMGTIVKNAVDTYGYAGTDKVGIVLSWEDGSEWKFTLKVEGLDQEVQEDALAPYLIHMRGRPSHLDDGKLRAMKGTVLGRKWSPPIEIPAVRDMLPQVQEKIDSLGMFGEVVAPGHWITWRNQRSGRWEFAKMTQVTIVSEGKNIDQVSRVRAQHYGSGASIPMSRIRLIAKSKIDRKGWKKLQDEGFGANLAVLLSSQFGPHDIWKIVARRIITDRREAREREVDKEARVRRIEEVGPWYDTLRNSLVVSWGKAKEATSSQDAIDGRVLRALFSKIKIPVRLTASSSGFNLQKKGEELTWKEYELVKSWLPNSVELRRYRGEDEKPQLSSSIFPSHTENKSDPYSDYWHPAGVRIAKEKVPEVQKLVLQKYLASGWPLTEEGERVAQELGVKTQAKKRAEAVMVGDPEREGLPKAGDLVIVSGLYAGKQIIDMYLLSSDWPRIEGRGRFSVRFSKAQWAQRVLQANTLNRKRYLTNYTGRGESGAEMKDFTHSKVRLREKKKTSKKKLGKVIVAEALQALGIGDLVVPGQSIWYQYYGYKPEYVGTF